MSFINDAMARRRFIRSGALLSASFALFNGANALPRTPEKNKEELFMIGPVEGYSPHVGTIVSMLNYNRYTIIQETKSLSMKELDHLFDEKANTIGGLLMHLGAVEKWYYNNCFENRDEFNEEEKKLWDAGMKLGDDGRQQIKGKEISYYLDLLAATREKTLKTLKEKDDRWLLAVDPEFGRDRKFNNYWKWFHVCEHESNHRGQIVWLKNRLPRAKPGKE